MAASTQAARQSGDEQLGFKLAFGARAAWRADIRQSRAKGLRVVDPSMGPKEWIDSELAFRWQGQQYRWVFSTQAGLFVEREILDRSAHHRWVNALPEVTAVHLLKEVDGEWHYVPRSGRGLPADFSHDAELYDLGDGKYLLHQLIGGDVWAGAHVLYLSPDGPPRYVFKAFNCTEDFFDMESSVSSDGPSADGTMAAPPPRCADAIELSFYGQAQGGPIIRFREEGEERVNRERRPYVLHTDFLVRPNGLEAVPEQTDEQLRGLPDKGRPIKRSPASFH